MFSFRWIIWKHTSAKLSHLSLGIVLSWAMQLNTLRPRQDGRYFADDVLKCIFLNENMWISLKIPLKFAPKGPINNIPALVQITAWRRPGDKPLSKPKMDKIPTHICVTRPQWVKRKWSIPMTFADSEFKFAIFTLVSGHLIATYVCTCHDSTAVEPSANFWSDHCVRIEMRTKRIWIVIERRLSEVGPGPGLFLLLTVAWTV